MDAQEYLGRSQAIRRPKIGPHGQLVRYAARLVEDGLVRHGTWRCLNLVGGLLSGSQTAAPIWADIDERMAIATSGTEVGSSPSSLVTGRR